MENHTFCLIINKVRLKKQRLKYQDHVIVYSIISTWRDILRCFSSNAVMTFVQFCIKMAVAMD